MAKSNTKGKAEKAKKVGSKSKTAAKPKAVKKIKKVAPKSKPAVKKPVKAAKVVAKKTPSNPAVKAKSAAKPKPVKKVVVAKSTAGKTPSKPVIALKSKALQTEKTKESQNTNLKDKKIVPAKVVNKNTGNFELGVVLRTGRRPEAIIKKNIETNNMGEEKLRYSEEELKEFEVLIL